MPASKRLLLGVCLAQIAQVHWGSQLSA
jgi:hypothetical protein